MDEHATAPLKHKSDWSPYPALVGVASPLLAVGIVLRSLALILVCVLLIGIAVGGWLREAGREHEAGRERGAGRAERTPEGPQDRLQRTSRQTMLALLAVVPLLALWIATGRMLVAHGLLTGGALLDVAAAGGRGLPLAMTLVILASPVAAQVAAAWRFPPSRTRLVLGTTLATILALTFLALLLAFHVRLRAAGVTPASSVEASAIHWILGLAGAQVLVVGAFSGVLAVRGALHIAPTGHRHAEAVAIVWASVALAWLSLAALLVWG